MQYKTEETLLYVENLSVGYEGKIIIKDINFVEHNITREGYESTGQVIAFIGRSGRGKSTLFKALTGLIKPSTGRIMLTDMESKIKDGAKVISEGDVGFVDQRYTLFRHKTVYQICKYALSKSLLNDKEKNELIEKYLSEWGLSEHKDKYSCQLSGGQKQRTSLLENILRNKHFLILDEPASGLDVVAIEKVKQYFTQFSNEDEDNTIIFSTHDINLAVELADSIYILGFPQGVTDYSTIVKHYDLKQMGIAWQEFGQSHIDLVKDIKALLAIS